MQLTDDQKQQTQDFLGARGLLKNCPSCGALGHIGSESCIYHYGPAVAALSYDIEKGEVVPGGESIPCVQVICTRCGSVQQFAVNKVFYDPAKA